MTDALAHRRQSLESFLARMRAMRHPCDRSEAGRAVAQARAELRQIERQLAVYDIE